MAPPPHALLLRLLLLLAAASASAAAGDGCAVGTGCDLALGSYLITPNQNFTYIAQLFGMADYKTLGPYNPGNPNVDFIAAGLTVTVYFRCGCLALPASAPSPSTTYLAASLPYKVQSGDTYTTIAAQYSNLTTADWLAATNTYPATNIPDTGTVNVTVNCSCGDARVSTDYGLFLTVPLAGHNLSAVAANYSFGSPEQLELLRKYNPGMDTATSGLVFIPVKDPSGSYLPLKSSGQFLFFCKLIMLPR